MTDRAADNGVGDTTTNLQLRAAAAALGATRTAAIMMEARAMATVKPVRTSNNDNNNATTQQRNDALQRWSPR